ncbi:hypothetical protein GW916_08400, partial [bacterium]|nr:hypothetical protein [bacterium]
RMFKTDHAERIKEIEMLADKGSNSKISQIMAKMDKVGADLSAAAGQLESLPRMALRSPSFVFAVNQRAQLLKELERSNELSQRMKVLGENSNLDKLKIWANQQAQSNRTVALRELKAHAMAEVKDYRVNINKLKLAEVEVIHRLNVDESLQGERSELGKMSQGRDTLIFPYEEEVWIDELDNYQAQVKDCPTSKGASL